MSNHLSLFVKPINIHIEQYINYICMYVTEVMKVLQYNNNASEDN